MNFQKYLNQVEREANEKMYEKLTTVLVEREESVVAIDNELNLLKFDNKEITHERLERLKNEVDKIDDAICDELKEMIYILVTYVVDSIKFSSRYINIKSSKYSKISDNTMFKKRGRIIANKVVSKIEQLLRETEDFTKYLYELIEELENTLNLSKVETDPEVVEEILKNSKNKYLKLHDKLSIERFLKNHRFVFERHGANHDIFKNPEGYIIALPRHNYEKSGLYIQKEVNEINKNRGIN